MSFSLDSLIISLAVERASIWGRIKRSGTPSQGQGIQSEGDLGRQGGGGASG